MGVECPDAIFLVSRCTNVAHCCAEIIFGESISLPEATTASFAHPAALSRASWPFS